MSAASWIRATCCTSPRSFSWCDKEQSDVVDSLKIRFSSEKAMDTQFTQDWGTQSVGRQIVLSLTEAIFRSPNVDLQSTTVFF